MHYRRSRDGFDTLLRVARASAAEPPSFATIIDAAEDASSLTLMFQLGARTQVEVLVQVDSRRLEILGAVEGRRARRVCALPFPVRANIDSSRTGDRLTVRIPKPTPTK
jgi:hypothetical protein